MTPPGPPTPRYSGTYESWPGYAQHCVDVILALDKVVRIRMRLGIRYNDVADLVQAAGALREHFQSWKQQDPGQDARGSAIAKLIDLRSQARQAGAEL